MANWQLHILNIIYKYYIRIYEFYWNLQYLKQTSLLEKFSHSEVKTYSKQLIVIVMRFWKFVNFSSRSKLKTTASCIRTAVKKAYFRTWEIAPVYKIIICSRSKLPKDRVINSISDSFELLAKRGKLTNSDLIRS